MSKSSVQKKAKADAAEYAAAYMAIGDGAGNRRKLIEGTVDYQSAFIPGYREAFEAEHAKQNMAKHAENARKANKRAERAESAQRNTKAVLSGDLKNADLKVIALIGAGIVIHRTGADKKVVNFVKTKWADHKRKHQKAARPNADGVYNISDAR